MKTLTRRRLLEWSGALSLPSLLAVPRTRAAGQPPPIGIQLFSVWKALADDVLGTLSSLRQVGYTEVEPAGFAGLTAKAFRAALATTGLGCPSAHFFPFQLDKLGAIFEDAHTLGLTYVTSSILRLGTGPLPDFALDPQHLSLRPQHIPPLRAMTLDDAQRTAELANRIGEAAKRAGFTYTYHNHYFEFADLGDGRIAYDILLRETDPQTVKFQIDCGWMITSGHDPVSYFERYPLRFPMIHVDDFVPLPTGDAAAPRQAFMRVGTELGRGFIDYRPILKAGLRAGLRYVFAEQQGWPLDSRGQLDAAQVDYRYLKSVAA